MDHCTQNVHIQQYYVKKLMIEIWIPDSLKKCTNCAYRKKDPKTLTPPSFISSTFHFDVLIWMTTSLQRGLVFL